MSKTNDIDLNTLRDAVYRDAVAHELWNGDYGPTDCAELIGDEVEKLGEAAVSWKTDYFCDCGDNGFAEELADVIIMSMSVAGYLDIDIDAAVKRKMEINKRRKWKHGKEG